jgi:hypothetical protein
MMSKRKQLGQSMVEYTVILIAITVGLSAVVIGNEKGLDDDNNPSLLGAMHTRYNQQSYAVRLTELPESQDLTAIVSYYSALNKYPELVNNMGQAATKIKEVTGKIDSVSSKLVELNNYKDKAQDLINKFK